MGGFRLFDKQPKCQCIDPETCPRKDSIQETENLKKNKTEEGYKEQKVSSNSFHFFLAFFQSLNAFVPVQETTKTMVQYVTS